MKKVILLAATLATTMAVSPEPQQICLGGSEAYCQAPLSLPGPLFEPVAPITVSADSE